MDQTQLCLWEDILEDKWGPLALLPTHRPKVSGSLNAHWLSWAGTRHVSQPGTFLENTLTARAGDLSPTLPRQDGELSRGEEDSHMAPAATLASAYLE